MFCPNCSEPRPANDTQFCKRCGLDLFGLNEFVESGESSSGRPFDGRRKAFRQTGVLFAIGLLLVPVWMFIGAAFPPNDRLVESAPSTTPAETIAWIGMWMAFFAGALRMAYALVFDGKRPIVSREMPAKTATHYAAQSLHSGDAFRPADPGVWQETDDLFEHSKRKVRTTGEL